MTNLSDELSTRLAAIVETSDDAIVSKDLNGIVKSWNAGAERIFGYTAQEMIGRPINTIIPPDRQNEELLILEKLRRGERVDHFQTIRMRKDGAPLNVSVTISPIKDHTGKVTGASKIARDITDYLRVQRERDELLVAERNARSEAERANRMKDEFMTTLSHELRTPINAILGWSQLIARSHDDPETVKEGMAVIERNAKSQAQLIEDLLDMARIISGKVRLNVQRMELLPVIEAALESVRPSADAKGITLVKILDPRAAVFGDPNRLQQVIWNLLSNAIKFTPTKGRVEMLVQRVNSHVEICVRDTGRGIKPDFLPYVFDRFRQADSSVTREYGGLGIGLAIVKHLVDLHGGQVRVRSAGEGQGATFCVELPLAVLKPGERSRESGSLSDNDSYAHEPISLRGMSILIVDDEPDTREMLSRLLRDCDAEVSAVESADNALKVLRDKKVDLLVSDIGMPHKDGYTFIREVRRLPSEREHWMPAIALTAFARPEDRTRAMMAGFQVHIAKPVDAQELIAAVASLVGRTG